MQGKTILNKAEYLDVRVLRAIGLYSTLFICVNLLFRVSESLSQLGWGNSLPVCIYIAVSLVTGIHLGLLWRSQPQSEIIRKQINSQLTKREKEVANLLISNLTNKEIECRLFISSNTIKTHIRNIYRKSNCKSRNELRSLFQD